MNETASALRESLVEVGDALRLLRVRLEAFHSEREIKDVDVQCLSATDLMKYVQTIQKFRRG